MDRLTPDQARKIHDAICATVGYLWRLNDRAFSSGLSVRDKKLSELIRAARDALHDLSIELHDQGCGHGVGRPPTDH